MSRMTLRYGTLDPSIPGRARRVSVVRDTTRQDDERVWNVASPGYQFRQPRIPATRRLSELLCTEAERLGRLKMVDGGMSGDWYRTCEAGGACKIDVRPRRRGTKRVGRVQGHCSCI